MIFGSFKGRAEELSEKAEGMSQPVGHTIDGALDDLNRGVAVTKAMGLSITHFHIEMGMIPKIHATLVGSLETVDEQRIHELIEQHRDNELLATLLQALSAALRIKQKVPDLSFNNVEVELKLGLPPAVSIAFID